MLSWPALDVGVLMKAFAGRKGSTLRHEGRKESERKEGRKGEVGEGGQTNGHCCVPDCRETPGDIAALGTHCPAASLQGADLAAEGTTLIKKLISDDST